ncbi:chemotaxis response regulator protein-glutamate methylesterase [bacterium]|nr:chemotaxis response regulator protein-glutamate methylesterase [bacterium]
MIRVLVVDDSILYRKTLKDILAGIEGVEVVGMASDGDEALQKIVLLKPDLVTLDVEMPGKSGLDVLRQLKRQPVETAVIMCSALTSSGAQTTIEALENGAFDFISKPDSPDRQRNTEEMRLQLKTKLAYFIARQKLRAITRAAPTVPAPAPVTPEPAVPVTTAKGVRKLEVVALGVSTGGPAALNRVIPMLPKDLALPVLVVIHMPPVFTATFAKGLDGKSQVRVLEAQEGQAVTPGTVYIAPGGKQMQAVRHYLTGRPVLHLTDDPPENFCKPSVDFLFRSVAELFGDRALGVIMTGMGADGVLGLKQMKRAGARVLAQDEKTCVVFGMPMEAIKAGVVDEVLPLDKIPERIAWLASLG